MTCNRNDHPCLKAPELLVARLGGDIALGNDPPPGHQVIWRGLSYLPILCHSYELTRELFAQRDQLLVAGQGQP